jgi:hypothetical protein
VTDEISKTLPFLPAEGVGIELRFSLLVFDLGFKTSLSQCERARVREFA